MSVHKILQRGTKHVSMILVSMTLARIMEEIATHLDHGADVAVPLRTSIVLEREPAEFHFLVAFALGVCFRIANQTQVSQTEHRKLAMDGLCIDVLVPDDVAKSCQLQCHCPYAEIALYLLPRGRMNNPHVTAIKDMDQ